MRLSFFLKVLIILLVPPLTFSQGILLDKDQSGGGCVAGMALNSEGLFIQGGGVATFAGRVDIGVQVSSEILDKYNYDEAAFAFWTEVYALREDIPKKVPLSVSLSYQVTNISSLSYSTFGASLYKRVGESKGSFIQPAASIFYSIETQRHPRTSALGFGLGISVASRIGQYVVFSFTPTFVNIHDEISGGMALGIMFSDTPRSKKDSKAKFDF